MFICDIYASFYSNKLYLCKDLTMKNSKGGEKKPVKDQNILHVIEPNRLTV